MEIEKLLGKIEQKGFSNKEIAEKLNIAESTFYRKLKRKSFSVEEAQKMSELLSLSATEAYEIFFGKRLA